MTRQTMDRYLSLVKEAALLAGQVLLKRNNPCRSVKTDTLHDIKISADTVSERLIIDFLARKTNFSILSEEAGMIEGANKDFCWIVDPLDGSLNYFRGIPMCCVSIGLWKRGAPLLGVVYDFNRLEMFSGIVGQGAKLNGRKITVSSVREKQKAILATGFPAQTQYSKKSVSNMVQTIQSYKKVRWFGSAALSVCYVACGRVDGYHEKNIFIWDVAGAIPVVKAAGGKVCTKETEKEYCLDVTIDNGSLK
ncbi:MAG: inositol monophosphatase [Candidatus Omnitrophica bacterium]|nr:inositol monophosphatase [Candidatus Omnitrophota bacterium]